MKAHQNMTLKELREYVRTNKLNKIVQLKMNKPALIVGLKKIDHWEEVEKKKRVVTKLQSKGLLQIGKKPDKPARIDTSNKNKGKVLKSEPKKELSKKEIVKQFKKELGKLLHRTLQSNTKNYPDFGTAMNFPNKIGDKVSLEDAEPKIKEIESALSKELLDKLRVLFIAGKGSNDAELLYDFKTKKVIFTKDNKKKK